MCEITHGRQGPALHVLYSMTNEAEGERDDPTRRTTWFGQPGEICVVMDSPCRFPDGLKAGSKL